jgi:hypothetical protein
MRTVVPPSRAARPSLIPRIISANEKLAWRRIPSAQYLLLRSPVRQPAFQSHGRGRRRPLDRGHRQCMRPCPGFVLLGFLANTAMMPRTLERGIMPDITTAGHLRCSGWAPPFFSSFEPVNLPNAPRFWHFCAIIQSKVPCTVTLPPRQDAERRAGSSNLKAHPTRALFIAILFL